MKSIDRKKKQRRRNAALKQGRTKGTIEIRI